jgi:hypothetical protein
MSERIIIGETTFICTSATARPAREWRRFTFEATVAEVTEAFTPGATFSREWDSNTYDEAGNQTGTEVLTEDMSDYCIPGDVVDHRDGTVTVTIGKKTEVEVLNETIDALVLEALTGGL